MRQTQDFGSVDLVVRTSLPNSELVPRLRELSNRSTQRSPQGTLSAPCSKSSTKLPRAPLRRPLASQVCRFALVLASLGIYAVISYSVSQRTQEIGIRNGPRRFRAKTSGQYLFQTLALAAVGILIGVASSWALARAISGSSSA